MAKESKYLIFVDTNIFLDFYRDRSLFSKDLESLLDKLISHKSLLITSDQVEMEFYKNRQSVIHDTFSNFKNLDWNKLKLPNIFEKSLEKTAFDKSKTEIDKQRMKVLKKFDKILENPARNDDFFKKINTVFAESSYRYSRDMKEEVKDDKGEKVLLRDYIYDKAKKRFLLGYPPRKKSDASFGDALNWEWVVYCAQKHKKHIVIVSRDSDYGRNSVQNKEALIINDWLLKEFKDRASKMRLLKLTNRISESLELASIKVTSKEKESELQLSAKFP